MIKVPGDQYTVTWGMEIRTHQGSHKRSSEPDGISLAFVADHVDLDTGRLQLEV